MERTGLVYNTYLGLVMEQLKSRLTLVPGLSNRLIPIFQSRRPELKSLQNMSQEVCL